MPPMNRREALKAAGLIAGGAFLASSGILTACGGEARARTVDRLLDADHQALAEEIADTLLPTTAASPGAKAAGVGPAMNLIVSDCYKANHQQQVLTGLETFRTTCRARRASGRRYAAGLTVAAACDFLRAAVFLCSAPRAVALSIVRTSSRC